jgi:hypothetical protein
VEHFEHKSENYAVEENFSLIVNLNP